MAKKPSESQTPETIAPEKATAAPVSVTSVPATSTGPERPQISSTDVDDFGLVVLSLMAITGCGRNDGVAKAKALDQATVTAIANEERSNNRRAVPGLLAQAHAKAQAR